MKKNIYFYVSLIGLAGITSCEPQFDEQLEDTTTTQTSGDADFSNYVAVGASITAGFGDGALYSSGQEVGFPALLAQQMEAAGGGEFTLPLMADNIGGFAGLEETFATRLLIDAALGAPVRANDNMSMNDVTASISGLYNNLGIPGAKSFHVGFPGYASLNPYFGRFATSAETTVVADAVAQNPTFFSLWLGGNDVLSYATSGGTGTDQFAAMNNEAEGYGNDDITSAGVFGGALSSSLDALTANGAKGVVFNVPSLSDLPFFTTVPNNALVLSAQDAADLTGFFRAYTAIVAGGITQSLVVGLGLDLESASAQANLIASQYAFTFNEGANLWLIATEVTNENPQGLRQMTASELLLLTIDQTALRTQGYGSVAVTDEVRTVLGKLQEEISITAEEAGLVISAVNPILDADVLDTTEINAISDATTAYNNTIAAVTSADPNLMLFDANGLVSTLRTTGLPHEGGSLSATIGNFQTTIGASAFSLDGIHLSPRGNAVFANAVIDEMNSYFGSTLTKLEPLNYSIVTLTEFGANN